MKFLLKTGILILLIAASAVNKLQAADYYWVGGSGNWSDYANHWATTSGGSVFNTQQPSLSDNVYFDNNSSAGDYTVTGNNLSCGEIQGGFNGFELTISADSLTVGTIFLDS